MEYISSINEPLKTISEENIEYIDLFQRPDLVFGTTQSSDVLSFEKFPEKTEDEINAYGDSVKKEYNNYRRCSTGCRLRLKTNSKTLIFRVELNREWPLRKMNLWTSAGFDVYENVNEVYKAKTVFAPHAGKKIFAHKITVNENPLTIFLPLYNEIKHLYIGIDKGCFLKKNPYLDDKPIIFYGNSITQGSSASRSGNCFCNIVSRNINTDIINLSISSCCKGLSSAAELIGSLQCKAIVIDYTRNANSVKELESNYENFYQSIRKAQPDVPIILMTVACFNKWRGYRGFDNIIEFTYQKAISRNEPTYLLNQTKLFKESEYDLVTIDGSHYTDYGMRKIAAEICNIINATRESF